MALDLLNIVVTYNRYITQVSRYLSSVLCLNNYDFFCRCVTIGKLNTHVTFPVLIKTQSVSIKKISAPMISSLKTYFIPNEITSKE
jgi:hypothetical protein